MDPDMVSLIDRVNRDPQTVVPELSIEELRHLVSASDGLYYVSENMEPFFSDTVYDLVRERLESLVGPVEYERKPTSGLIETSKFHLGSMNKAKEGDGSMTNWLHRYPGPYVVSLKLDGASALYYRDKSTGQMKLTSRGGSGESQDLTHLLSHLNLPDLPANVSAVRGEMIIPRSVFENERLIREDTGTFDENGQPIYIYYKSGRNAVSGLVNSLPTSYKAQVAMKTHFVVYEQIASTSTHGSKTEIPLSQQLTNLTALGFNVVPYQILTSTDESKLSQLMDTSLETSDYEIDGLIVHIDAPYQRNTSGNPDYAIAFKKPLDFRETTVIGVKWQVGTRNSVKLTPVAIYEPVVIDGNVYQHVTVHNARRVVERKIGPGAIIKILRSGRVIPHIYQVLQPATSGEGSLPDFPYVWNKSGVDIELAPFQDDQSEEVSGLRETGKINRIHGFLSTIGVEKAGPKTVASIYNAIKSGKGPTAGDPTINDFLRLTADQIRFLGPKTSETLASNIQRSLQRATVNRLVAGSGLMGLGMGERKMDAITAQLPDFWTRYPIPFQTENIYRDLLGLSGVAETTAQLLSENYEKFYRFFIGIKDLLNPEITANGPRVFTLDRLAALSGLFSKIPAEHLETLLTNSTTDPGLMQRPATVPISVYEEFRVVLPTFYDWVQELEVFYGKLVSRQVKPQQPAISAPLSPSRDRMVSGTRPIDQLISQSGETVALLPIVNSSVGQMQPTVSYRKPIPALVVLSDLKNKKKYEVEIQNLGGSIGNSVTNSTDLVVVGDASVNSGKKKKADEKGIPVVTLDDFIRDYLTPVTPTSTKGPTVPGATVIVPTVIGPTGPGSTVPGPTVPVRSAVLGSTLPVSTVTRTSDLILQNSELTQTISPIVTPTTSDASSLPVDKVKVLTSQFTLDEIELLLEGGSSPKRDKLVAQMHQILESLPSKMKHRLVREAKKVKLEVLERLRQSFRVDEINLLLEKSPSLEQKVERARLIGIMNAIFTDNVVASGREKVSLLRRLL